MASVSEQEGWLLQLRRRSGVPITPPLRVRRARRGATAGGGGAGDAASALRVQRDRCAHRRAYCIHPPAYAAPRPLV